MTNTKIKAEIIKITKYADDVRIVIDIDGNDEEAYHIQGNVWHDGDFTDFFIEEVATSEEAEKKVNKIVAYLKKQFGDKVEGA